MLVPQGCLRCCNAVHLFSLYAAMLHLWSNLHPPSDKKSSFKFELLNDCPELAAGAHTVLRKFLISGQCPGSTVSPLWYQFAPSGTNYMLLLFSAVFPYPSLKLSGIRSVGIALRESKSRLEIYSDSPHRPAPHTRPNTRWLPSATAGFASCCS